MKETPLISSVFPDWIQALPFQQQTVLVLALRGPDGDVKYTSFKVLLRAYRGTVLRAAKWGRLLEWGEKADDFMSLDIIADLDRWEEAVKRYCFHEADAAVLHHYTHFMHGTEILAYKHPDIRFRKHWKLCYHLLAERLHLNMETRDVLDQRLNDWGRERGECIFGIESSPNARKERTLHGTRRYSALSHSGYSGSCTRLHKGLTRPVK